jgi:ribosomal protein S18 acetylase RimI-like enzyme
MVKRPTSGDVWSEVVIRPAKPSEAQIIQSILCDSFEEYRSKYTSAAFQAVVPEESAIIECMKEGPVWVAVHHDEIVGTISAVPLAKEMQIRMMAVPPAERGKEIGRMLLVHLAKYAFNKGYRRLSLSINPFLTRAIREYEQFGFERTSEQPSDLHGTPVYTMTKYL